MDIPAPDGQVDNARKSARMGPERPLQAKTILNWKRIWRGRRYRPRLQADWRASFGLSGPNWRGDLALRGIERDHSRDRKLRAIAPCPKCFGLGRGRFHQTIQERANKIETAVIFFTLELNRIPRIPPSSWRPAAAHLLGLGIRVRRSISVNELEKALHENPLSVETRDPVVR